MPTLASDVMTTDLQTARASTDLATAWNLMEDARIRHLPVVDDDDRVVGLVSHRDLAREALGMVEELPMHQRQEALAALRVEQIMTRGPETAQPDETLAAIGERMLDNKFGCMLIVEGERLVGLLTESDFVRMVVEREDAD